jgi:hypothetical protein
MNAAHTFTSRTPAPRGATRMLRAAAADKRRQQDAIRACQAPAQTPSCAPRCIGAACATRRPLFAATTHNAKNSVALQPPSATGCGLAGGRRCRLVRRSRPHSRGSFVVSQAGAHTSCGSPCCNQSAPRACAEDTMTGATGTARATLRAAPFVYAALNSSGRVFVQSATAPLYPAAARIGAHAAPRRRRTGGAHPPAAAVGVRGAADGSSCERHFFHCSGSAARRPGSCHALSHCCELQRRCVH